MKIAVRALAILLALSAGWPERTRAADAPVVAWASRIPSPAGFLGSVREARLSADGSLFVLMGTGDHVYRALVFDESDRVLSDAMFAITDARPYLVDRQGGVYMGRIFDGEPPFLAKFDGYTGRRLWTAPIVGEPLLDGRGDILLLDHSSRTLSKLDGFTGLPVWGPKPAAVGTIEVDPAGDLISVTTLFDAPTGAYSLSVAKYSGKTGDLVAGPVTSPLPGWFYAERMRLQGDGGLILAGEDGSGIAAAAVDSAWKVRWFSSAPGMAGWNTGIVAVLPTVDGIVIAGTYIYPFPAFGYVPFLVRFDAGDGHLVWGPLTELGSDSWYRGIVDARLTDTGDLLVALWEGTRGDPVSLYRLDAGTGAERWGPVLVGTGNVGLDRDAAGRTVAASTQLGKPAFLSIARVSDEGALVSRTENELHNGFGSGAAAALAVDPRGDIITVFNDVLKFDGRDGSLLWASTARAEGKYRTVPQPALDPGGDLFLGTQAGLLKTDGTTGAVVWGPVDPRVSPQSSTVYAVSDASGDAFAFGLVSTSMGRPGGLLVAKLAGETGATLVPARTITPTATQLTWFGNAVLGPDGSVTAIATGSYDKGAMTCRVSNAGELLWTVEDGASVGPRSLAVDGAGDVIECAPGRVQKRSGADGTLIWSRSFAGFGTARAAVDSSRDIVFSWTYPNGTSELRKLSGATGETAWGPLTWSDLVLGEMALDEAGEVYVTASRPTALDGVEKDVLLLGFSGATGAELWPRATWGGPGDDVASHLALRNGMPVIAGSSDSLGTFVAAFRTGIGFEGPADLPAALCGVPYETVLTLRNSVGPLTSSVKSGSLPPGLALSGLGISGTASGEGVFRFTIRVVDALGAAAERAFTIAVAPAHDVAIEGGGQVVVRGASATLSAPPGFASYLWSPGGQTTPEITVAPCFSRSYGVEASDGSCTHRGAVDLVVVAGPDLAIQAPSTATAGASGLVAWVPEHSGSTYAWTIAGGVIEGGQGTSRLVFAAGAGGELTLAATETTAAGCALPGGRRVAVTAPPTGFFPISPCRVLDTRLDGAPLAADETRRVAVAGVCGVPPDARAVAANVTVVSPSGSGGLAVTPAPEGRTEARPVAFTAGRTRATSVVAPLGEAGALDVSTDAGSGSLDLVLDVSGYFR